MNWEQRINEAERRGFFVYEDHIDAGGWRKCAVGETLNLSEYEGSVGNLNIVKALRDVANDYSDEEINSLLRLGGNFPLAVHGEDFAEARDILHQIQEIQSQHDHPMIPEFQPQKEPMPS